MINGKAFTSAAVKIRLIPDFVPTDAASDGSCTSSGTESIAEIVTSYAHTTPPYSTPRRATTNHSKRLLLPQLRNLLIFLHPSHLSKSSIAPADVYGAASADASEGSIAGADDGCLFSEDFFSSLLRLLNGEVDRRAVPVEEDEGAERRDDYCTSTATRNFFGYHTTSASSPTGETSTTSTFGSE
ncbi:uncharacterized protein MONOS_7753 [Monocercomonoides exilis]|uniref:uncharacterized protein n=1 Tax=Monocercomonoides exilis TaxID=2049356 RepID=UPI003559A999|nr:hypothetical protein MONOS_7753 [Monocercomonoides exilis]|eukprot:MONOS_7753.1-p1 / transcript=MONOS_7753.1 / gene=MONOS_7753 / organism=Monocercomonoides_exilis_PA203 / gene_product=unspecified product / transcript_product=unspecified product / location=Mono_scaffold00273:44306-45149(+) / protein_length=185 / sequence_SO=supercontig / SO=protein_coding / is_pseudo=false